MIDLIRGLFGLKHGLYLYLDSLLLEAKEVGKDEFDAWIEKKRLELKQLAAE